MLSENIKKANIALLFLCIVFIFGCVLLRLLNLEYLQLEVATQSFIKMKLINLTSFTIQIGLMFGILTKLKRSKCLTLTLIYIPIYILTDIACSGNLIHTTIAPILFILISSSFEEENIITVIRNTIIFIAISAIYQLAMIYARTNITSLITISNQLEILERQGLCVDYIILLFVILVERRNLYAKFSIYTNEKCNAKISNEDCESVAIFNNLTKIAKMKVITIIAGVQILQLLAIGITALLIDRVPEFIFILISFWLARSYLQPSFHANNVLLCTGISVAIFYIAAASTIPITISIFSSLLVGSIIGLIMHATHIIINKLKPNEEAKQLTLENITIENLEEVAKVYNLNKETEEFLKLKYIDKLKNTEIAELLYIEPHSVAMRVNRIKKKINKIIEIKQEE